MALRPKCESISVHVPEFKSYMRRCSMACILVLAISVFLVCAVDVDNVYAEDINDSSLSDSSLSSYRQAATETDPLTILVDTTVAARTSSDTTCYTPKITWKCLNYLSKLAAGATTGTYVEEPTTIRMVDKTNNRWQWTFSPLDTAITTAEPYFLDVACYSATSFENLAGFKSFSDYLGEDAMMAYPNAAQNSVYVATESWNDFTKTGCKASLRVKVSDISDDIQPGDMVRIACYAAQTLPLHSAWYTSSTRMPDLQIVENSGQLDATQVVCSRVDSNGYVEFSPEVGGNYVISKVTELPATSQTDIGTCSISKIDDQIWTGESVKPSVSVKNAQGVTLVEGFDYTVAYTNNVDTGTATATVTGVGAYKQSATANFEIVYPDPEPTNSVTVGTYCISPISESLSQDALSVGYQNLSAGTRLELDSSDETIWQRFKIQRIDSSGTYVISSSESGNFLTAATSTSGNKVSQEAYVNGWSAQEWTIYDAGNGRFCFKSVSTGLFLTIVEGSSGNSTITLNGSSVTSTLQLFSLDKKTNTESSDNKILTSALGGSCVLGFASGTEDTIGAVCTAVDNDGTGQQSFSLEYADDGYYRIRSYLSGYYLTASTSSTDASVVQKEKTDSALQKWSVLYDGLGRATYVNAMTGCALGPATKNLPVAGTTFAVLQRDGSVMERFYSTSVTPQAATRTKNWYAGGSRYSTAALEALSAYPNGAKCVIITSGENWKDALGASSLSGALDAPILLTQPSGVSQETLDAISLLKKEGSSSVEVIAVGGSAVVSDDALAQYSSAAGDTSPTRISGGNYQETNQQIYKYGVQNGLWDNTVILATSASYADALSASPVAYALRAPVLLVSDGSLDVTQDAEVSSFDRALLLGGSACISSQTESQLRGQVASVIRLGGGDRYETSSIIATWATGEGVLSWDGAAFATGTVFPDALAGAALQGSRGSVLLLAENTSSVTVSTLISNRGSVNSLSFLGGSARFPESLQSTICANLWTGAYKNNIMDSLG